MIKPFAGDFRMTDDFAAHLARQSTAPGIDWTLPQGTPVIAADSGVVSWAHWGPKGGRYVMVNHGNGMHSLYSHLQWLAVGKGEPVHRGQLIGLSGRTGNATGPCLHFSLKRDGVWVDPLMVIQ